MQAGKGSQSCLDKPYRCYGALLVNMGYCHALNKVVLIEPPT
jgi:hypothetical protein